MQEKKVFETQITQIKTRNSLFYLHNREWRPVAYVVDGGKFSIDLTYPDQVDPQEDISDRRPAIVRRYFADMKVDYSKPN
jgi:hypothetical protein